MHITLIRLHCKRCGHRWVPTQPIIKICPKCKSANWETKRTNRQGLRQEKKS
jgi:uncharacterized OB-fold protein